MASIHGTVILQDIGVEMVDGTCCRRQCISTFDSNLQNRPCHQTSFSLDLVSTSAHVFIPTPYTDPQTGSPLLHRPPPSCSYRLDSRQLARPGGTAGGVSQALRAHTGGGAEGENARVPARNGLGAFVQVPGQASTKDAVPADQRGELCGEFAYCHFLVEDLGIYQVANSGWGGGVGDLVLLG